MSNGFEAVSILGKTISLTETQLQHIRGRHPEFEGEIRKIKECIEQPDAVLYDPAEDNYQYYRYFEKTPIGSKYLLAVVRHLNGNGFVITALFVSRGKIRLLDKECVYGKIEDLY